MKLQRNLLKVTNQYNHFLDKKLSGGKKINKGKRGAPGAKYNYIRKIADLYNKSTIDLHRHHRA